MESVVISPIFGDSSETPELFFNILPQEWRDGIVPFWNDYSDSSRIFTLVEKGVTIGGGIVFKKPSPDSKPYQDEAQELFDKGLLYFGFLWIDPEFRGKNLGTFWIEKLKNHYDGRLFWLSIEEKKLAKFYERNNFKILKKISFSSNVEWIMVPSDF